MSSILRALPVLLLASHALAGPVSARSNFLDCIKEKTGMVLKDMDQAKNIRQGITAPETCTQKEYNTMFDACCKSTGESHSGNMRPASHDADDRHGTPPPDASSDALTGLAPDAKDLTNVDGSRKQPELAEPASDAPRPEVSPPPSDASSDVDAPKKLDPSVKDAPIVKGSDRSPTAQRIPPSDGDAPNKLAPSVKDGPIVTPPPSTAHPTDGGASNALAHNVEDVPKQADGSNAALPDASVSEKKVEPITPPSAKDAPKVKGSEAGSGKKVDPNAEKGEGPDASRLPSDPLPAAGASKTNLEDVPKKVDGSNDPSVSEKKVEPITAPIAEKAPIANESQAGSKALPDPSVSEKKLDPNADATKATKVSVEGSADAMSPAGGKDEGERKKVVDLSPANASGEESKVKDAKLDAGGKESKVKDTPEPKVVDPNSPVKSDPNASLAKELDAMRLAGGKDEPKNAVDLSNPANTLPAKELDAGGKESMVEGEPLKKVVDLSPANASPAAKELDAGGKESMGKGTSEPPKMCICPL